MRCNGFHCTKKESEGYQGESFDGATNDVVGHGRNGDAFRQTERAAVEIHDDHVQQLGDFVAQRAGFKSRR